MGDFYKRIVDVEVSHEEAGPLAGRMVDWMVAEGLITRELSGTAVYSLDVDEGYVPGPNWARAAEDWGDDHIPAPVAVIVGRNYHVGGQGEDAATYAVCPHCDKRMVFIDYPESFEPDEEVWQPFRDAIDTWKETGEASVPCAACETSVPITAWQWDSEFALGALAFDFWGWPPLTDDFVAEFTRQLGHRTAQHSGKF
ncbi:hypothetical protein OG905_01030 [Streptomyces sp. NBC_00322]|uniref:hypothetical protein n=1 Tax=Streptomyces sp. NBC_00322 TaxID=2975712 RepID=UPI002E2A8CFD|nr:hypothetical protein [Streptomyces sp. NBC_00322]